MDWNRPVSVSDVEEAFRLILQRDVENDYYAEELERAKLPFSSLIDTLIRSAEFDGLHKRRVANDDIAKARNDGLVSSLEFRNPDTFRVTPPQIRNVLMLGSCLSVAWVHILNGQADGPTISHHDVRGGPALSAAEAATFDFQIIQLPVRLVVPEGLIYGIPADDIAAFEAAFSTACELLTQLVHDSLRFQREFGMTTFILNFPLPQQNPLGRMAPRYALSNPVHFTEQLNRVLDGLISGLPRVHLVDFDQIVAGLGRRYFQDDLTNQTNHGSLLGPINMSPEEDAQRLEPLGDVDKLYGGRQWEHVVAAYREIEGMYRSIRQADAIKIVIFDLDDTLWRGVAADTDTLDASMIEGWPLGIIEAVSYLWRRGIALAIVSKNDEDVAVQSWNKLYHRLFPIENFVIRKINWEPKAANVQAILNSVNLLPDNALFVDDNPVERAAVKAAFPQMRVMDAPVATWRRNLLWTPELQTATFTAEGAHRTEMLQRQIERNAAQHDFSDRGAFLASLGLALEHATVVVESDPRFSRCYELLNKTNQFNTTGRRWAPAEMMAFLKRGGKIVMMSAQDRFTAYGIVAVAIVFGDEIVQVVMSCRVFGMGVEQALMSVTLDTIAAAGYSEVRGETVDNGLNRLSMTLFEMCGFAKINERCWRRPIGAGITIPAHVSRLDHTPVATDQPAAE